MDELKIKIITYNVGSRNPEGNISDILSLENRDNKNLPDFYVIGLQEVKAKPHNYLLDVLFTDPWTAVFKEVLGPLGYVKGKTLRLVGIILTFFCLRKHVVHLRDMKNICTRTGLKGFWGNKGGVTQRLQIYGCSLCFVNCHLAAHDHLYYERVADYNNILQNQKFEGCKEATSILFHDYVFWFGDLNFRLNNEKELDAMTIVNAIKENELERLLKDDQLLQAMASGEAFSELTESDVKFPPSYKYFYNTSTYDPSRRPGWTDRILYKVNANVYENVTLETVQKSYNVVENAFASDHKPVIGAFSVKVFSNYVERTIKFLPIGTWYTNTTNKAVCIMSSDVEPNAWDWIGIFHDDFSSLDEYVAFIYIPSNPDLPNAPILRNGDRIELTFFENIIRIPRKYRLIYFTEDSSSVLGMSQPFELKLREEDTPDIALDW